MKTFGYREREGAILNLIMKSINWKWLLHITWHCVTWLVFVIHGLLIVQLLRITWLLSFHKFHRQESRHLQLPSHIEASKVNFFSNIVDKSTNSILQFSEQRHFVLGISNSFTLAINFILLLLPNHNILQASFRTSIVCQIAYRLHHTSFSNFSR